MNISQLMEQYAMQRELAMLDKQYEGMLKAVSGQYQTMRAGVYKEYGVEEPKPEPEPVQGAAAVNTAMETDADIPLHAEPAMSNNDTAALRRAAGLGVVPGNRRS